jgi:hypothetical protein
MGIKDFESSHILISLFNFEAVFFFSKIKLKNLILKLARFSNRSVHNHLRIKKNGFD